ncbi:MAG: phytanoyl-CoA dioxygenase family protein [Caldilineaceae bacterium]
MSTTVAADWQSHFDEEGYVVLHNFFTPALIDQARQALTTLVDQFAAQLVANGTRTSTLPDEPFPTRLLRLYAGQLAQAPNLLRRELHLPGLFAIFFHSQLLDLVEQLLGGEIRLYPNYSARPKYPDFAPTEVLWHQDGGYTEGAVEQLRMVNVWAPLVPARVDNGCMQFIPGTHRLGVVPHERRDYYLEIREDALAPRLAQAIPMELDPGDLVLFHNLLFHRGLPNHADHIRWSLDWRYQDATQPTLRKEAGHLARSQQHSDQVVRNADHWAQLHFR